MSSKSLCNPVRNLDMSGFSGNFSLEKVFDDLHFTNSPNAFFFIVGIYISIYRSYCLSQCHIIQNSQCKVRSLIVGHQSSETHTRGGGRCTFTKVLAKKDLNYVDLS
jgi:hypothetical protein